MSDYRRHYRPGATYFFTLVTARRRPHFADPVNVQHLRTAFRHVMASHPFMVDAMVVLPDHLHALWTLPAGDADFSTRWRLIKRRVSCAAACSGFWQRRFWEHWVRDEQDLARYRDYIHYNPVKHGYVSHPADWPNSSFRRDVARGLYPADWGATPPQELDGLERE